MQPTPHSESGPSDQPRAPPPPAASPLGAAGPARGARPSPPPGLRAQPGSSTPGTGDPAARPAVHAVRFPARQPGRALRSRTLQPDPRHPGTGPPGPPHSPRTACCTSLRTVRTKAWKGGAAWARPRRAPAGPRPRVVAPPPGPRAPNRVTAPPLPTPTGLPLPGAPP